MHSHDACIGQFDKSANDFNQCQGIERRLHGMNAHFSYFALHIKVTYFIKWTFINVPAKNQLRWAKKRPFKCWFVIDFFCRQFIFAGSVYNFRRFGGLNNKRSQCQRWQRNDKKQTVLVAWLRELAVLVLQLANRFNVAILQKAAVFHILSNLRIKSWLITYMRWYLQARK